ncbi:dd0f818c-546d-4dde-aa87-ded62e4761c3 [Thermothielavioides terrestris]|uniref:Dd0f818c-546d-4dde-aa87-ded62e4761c3 n=1 Tax=Thermothielavioides terrestris TaxID=2587410 RepID=A0A446BQL1_9PEZI|nr:dd0f818c-546d-4dde-aa87-ded62e4761c3 [Thermothielavioides terrestris]
MATQLSEQLKYSQAKGADKVVLGPAAPEADRLVAHQHVELGDETREPNLQEVQLVLKLVQPVMSTRAGSGIG